MTHIDDIRTRLSLANRHDPDEDPTWKDVEALLSALDAAREALSWIYNECSCNTPDLCFDVARDALAAIDSEGKDGTE